jgi:hypothetical protein
MVFLVLILAVLLAGIIYFAVKKSKIKVENKQTVVEDEGLPRFKFDD